LKKTNKLEKAKTAESEILERISDAFVSLDASWHYTYVNKKAGEVFNRKPEDLVGKHIWTEFPEGIGQPFHLAYEKAMKEQQYVYLEEYYPPYDRWFENHIYPSPTGLSIYFKDNTEKKKAELELQKSEEKYRTVIKQASDGIFIGDQLGNCIEVNDSGCKLLGYEREEILTKNIKNAIIFNDDEIPLRLNELKEGKSIIQKRKMKRKDGSFLFVEISSQKLPDGNVIGVFRDLTERIEAEKKLQREIELSDKIINSLPGLFYLADPTPKLIRWNNEFEKVSGYSSEELKKAVPVTLFDPEDQLILKRALEKSYKEGLSDVEVRLLTKHGEKIPYYFTSAAIHYNGKPAILGTGINLTERKKAEQELELARINYLSLINNIDGIVWEADAKTFQFGFVSKQAERLLGYPVEQWINEPTFWKDHIYEADRSWAVNYCIQCTLEKKAHEFEYRMVAADGKLVWLRDIVTVLIENNEPVSLRGVMVDITERKKAEQEIKKSNERFELIAKATNDAVWDWNMETDETWGNETLYNFYDLDFSTDKLSSNTFFEHIHPEDVNRVKESMNNALNTSAQSITEEFRFRKKDGSYRIVIDRAYVYYNKEGKPTRMLGAMQDITEKKEAEAEKEKERRNATALINSTTDLLWSINKDFKLIKANDAFIKGLLDNGGYLIKPGDDILPEERFPQEYLQYWKDLYSKGLSGEKVLTEIYTPQANSTELLWFEIKTDPIKEGNEITGIACSMRNITERKKADILLSQSINALKEAQRIAQTGSWELDLLTNQPKWSDEVYRILELNVQNTSPSYELFLNAIHPEDREAVNNAYTNSIKNKTTYDINHRLLFPDGRIKYVREQCETIYNEEGTPLRSLGTIQDITKAKNAELVLNESEKKYKNLFYNNPVPLWVINRENSQIVDVNEAAIKHYGYSYEEFLQMTSKQLRPTFEYERYDAFIKEYGRTIEGNIGIWNHIKKDGTLINVELTVHTIFYNNLPCRLVLANDITEKMKVEKRLEFLVSASPAVIYSAAAEFPFGATFISENIKEQTGHVPKEFTSNPNFWSDHIHPLDKERVLKDIGHLFKEGRYTHEYRFRLKDGSYTWMYDEVKLLYDSAGKPLEMIGYWIKINERKQAEEKINQTNEQLRQLTTHLQKIREEERKRIGREIHDDLGQQLTAIKMDVAWVDKKIPAETTLIKSKLKNIITLLDGSNQSIRRILTELRPGILDDYGLLEALDWHGRQFTANTGIQVTINTNESEIKLSEPIATCLFRVYQEALTNISKHAHADKAIVSINLNDETIFMHINDNGRGFDDHSQKKRTSFGILGMKERVHSVKGDFELSSKPGMGTKISITIPLT